MYKMKPCIFIAVGILICCLMPIRIKAQYIHAGHELEQFVIAFSGVKLREKPDFKSRTLGVIPFGEKVILSEYFDRWEERKNQVYSSDSIAGVFLEAEANGKRGFVFSAYLSSSYYKLDKPMHMFSGNYLGFCETPAISNQYLYYAIELNHETQKVSIVKKVPIIHDGIAQVEPMENVIFTIASKTPIAADGPIAMSCGNLSETELKEGEQVLIPHTNFELHLKQIMAQTGEMEKRLTCVNTRTKQNQILGNYTFETSFSLLWYGDLDRDGHQDFIISVGGEHSGEWQLFLSRDYLKQKEWKPSATAALEDCC
jgi:hypothetical protein